MNGRTRLPESWRMPLRVAAVFLAYVLYRVPGDDRLGAGVLLGVGSFMLASVVIDRLTLPRVDRSGLLQVGTTVLGLGFVAVGLMLAVR